MGRKLLVVLGGVLAIVALLMFVYDIWAVRSYVVLLFGIVAVLTSFLAGKKIAAYHHDINYARAHNYKLAPSAMVYLWILFFIGMLVIYTIVKIAIGYFVKVLLLPFGGQLMGIIYNFLMLLGAYILFLGIYSKRDGFVTLWGKAADKTSRLMKPADKMVDSSKAMMSEAMDDMKKFMP